MCRAGPFGDKICQLVVHIFVCLRSTYAVMIAVAMEVGRASIMEHILADLVDYRWGWEASRWRFSQVVRSDTWHSAQWSTKWIKGERVWDFTALWRKNCFTISFLFFLISRMKADWIVVAQLLAADWRPGESQHLSWLPWSIFFHGKGRFIYQQRGLKFRSPLPLECFIFQMAGKSANDAARFVILSQTKW